MVSLGQFSYLWAKGVIKDVGRVLEIPFEVTNEMTKKIGDESIEQVLDSGLLKEYENKYPKLFEYVGKLAGLPKSFGAHPCFVGSTLVLTDTGYKPISEVQVGDSVLTHTGNYKLVVNTSCTQNKTLTIKMYGGFNIECTYNHPFYVRHRLSVRKKIYSEPEWVEAKDLVKSDMLCYPINNNNIIPHYKNLPTDDEDFWWIVGRYMGDGWCVYHERPRNSKNVIICCDNHTDIHLNNILSRAKKFFDYRYESDKSTYRIFIKDIEMFEYLQRFGKYAYGKHLTNDILDLPVNLIVAFLNGYLSADGFKGKDGFYLCKTVSFRLANGIMQCVAKAYHMMCGSCVIPPCVDTIEGRKVNSREKYTVTFKEDKRPKDRNFYDETNNCLWCYVKSVEINGDDIKNVYNLSVVDDNSYTANGMAVHNCGKCITIDSTDTYNAVEYDDKNSEWVLQGDMHTADDLGLVKCDFLGLRTLDVIYDTLNMIGKDYNYIAPHKIDTSDKEVWAEFAAGHTDCIFQFESDGMKSMLKDMHCNCIEDLSASNALYRPGAKAFIPNYINRKKGSEHITYLHPDLKPILKNTYGIIIFQEQLIEIGRLAGLPNPDELRKATAKKKPELMAKIEPLLKDGLMKRGWEKETCDELWETILDFARYSFNKCVSGSTVIAKPSNRKDRRSPTVEEMYKITHDIQFAKENNYIPLRGKYLRQKHYSKGLSMFSDGRVRINIIRDIQPAGVRPIYRVTTENGMFLDCTDNHKFPTPNGQKMLSELSVGDELYILGKYEKCKNKYNFTDGNFKKNIPAKGQMGFQKIPDGASVKFEEYKQYCKTNQLPCAVCGIPYTSGVRFELHHNDKDRTNNEQSNLTWCCVSCHKKLDYALGRTKMFEKGIPTLIDKIISIEYIRDEMTYDVTMDNPAHNFVANNGLITCNSHSSAYALTAYISMYLKVHHPSEFIAACINSWEGDITGIVKTINEARRMGIEILFDDWRHAQSKTTTRDGKIYLGLNTIKGFGNSIAEALQRIAQKATTFTEVLVLAKQDSDISDSQLETLISHDFFGEFGDVNNLLGIHTIFKQVYGRKTFSKNSELPISEDILRMFSKETAKQFRDIKSDELITYLTEHLQVTPRPLVVTLNSELKDFGYIRYTNDKADKMFYITDIDTKYSPKLTFYNLKKGLSFVAKISKKDFAKNPVCVGNLIRADFQVKPKMRKEGDTFVPEPNIKEYWVKTYSIVK